MKQKIIQLVLLILSIITFFFPMFVLEEGLPSVNGFNSIFDARFHIYGNIIIGLVLLITIYRLIYTILSMIIPDKISKLESISTMIISTQMLLAILVVTLLGLRLDWIGMLMIFLVVSSAILGYKDPKKIR